MIAAVGLLAYAVLLVLLAAPAVGAFGREYCPEVAAAAQPGPVTAHCADTGC